MVCCCVAGWWHTWYCWQSLGRLFEGDEQAHWPSRHVSSVQSGGGSASLWCSAEIRLAVHVVWSLPIVYSSRWAWRQCSTLPASCMPLCLRSCCPLGYPVSRVTYPPCLGLNGFTVTVSLPKGSYRCFVLIQYKLFCLNCNISSIAVWSMGKFLPKVTLLWTLVLDIAKPLLPLCSSPGSTLLSGHGVAHWHTQREASLYLFVCATSLNTSRFLLCQYYHQASACSSCTVFNLESLTRQWL